MLGLLHHQWHAILGFVGIALWLLFFDGMIRCLSRWSRWGTIGFGCLIFDFQPFRSGPTSLALRGGINSHSSRQSNKHNNRNSSNQENQWVVNSNPVLVVLYWVHDNDLDNHSNSNGANVEIAKKAMRTFLEVPAHLFTVDPEEEPELIRILPLGTQRRHQWNPDLEYRPREYCWNHHSGPLRDSWGALQMET